MSDPIVAVTMPRWGLSMTEGKVVGWLAAIGDTVRRGQDLVDIETTKITNIHECPEDGTLRRILVTDGSDAVVGGLLAIISAPAVSDAEIEDFVKGFKVPEVTVDEDGAVVGGPVPKRMTVGAVSLQYLDLGDRAAAPIVLVHGFGGDLNNWMFSWPVLEKTNRVIVIDLPGHGGSDKAVLPRSVDELAHSVLGVIDALNLSQVHLVGHSLGGAVVGLAALARPALVSRLTLIASLGLGTEVNAGYMVGFIAADRRKDLLPIASLLFADPSSITRDLVDDLMKFKRLDGVKQALTAIRDAAITDGHQNVRLLPQLLDLGMPIRIIWGADDQIIPASHAAALAGRIETHILPGAGHMVHIERVEEVNEILLQS